MGGGHARHSVFLKCDTFRYVHYPVLLYVQHALQVTTFLYAYQITLKSVLSSPLSDISLFVPESPRLSSDCPQISCKSKAERWRRNESVQTIFSALPERDITDTIPLLSQQPTNLRQDQPPSANHTKTPRSSPNKGLARALFPPSHSFFVSPACRVDAALVSKQHPLPPALEICDAVLINWHPSPRRDIPENVLGEPPRDFGDDGCATSSDG